MKVASSAWPRIHCSMICSCVFTCPNIIDMTLNSGKGVCYRKLENINLYIVLELCCHKKPFNETCKPLLRLPPIAIQGVSCDILAQESPSRNFTCDGVQFRLLIRDTSAVRVPRVCKFILFEHIYFWMGGGSTVLYIYFGFFFRAHVGGGT